MVSFSQRIGKTPIKNSIQAESIDDELKNALWNGLAICYWNNIIKNDWIDSNEKETVLFFKRLWIHFFKNRLDEMPLTFYEYHRSIKEFFFRANWYEIYDLIEFIPLNYEKTYSENNKSFINYCNKVLEVHLSAYRFINEKLTPISANEEILAIEEAIDSKDNLRPVTAHLVRAMELLSDRKLPDYRNSIKESISAVESYCAIITNKPKSTLGQALKQIEKDNSIHPALKNSFSNLYGYTSDANGIRHALLEEDNLKQEDAKFMIVACSAFINYLKQKEAKVKT